MAESVETIGLHIMKMTLKSDYQPHPFMLEPVIMNSHARTYEHTTIIQLKEYQIDVPLT